MSRDDQCDRQTSRGDKHDVDVNIISQHRLPTNQSSIHFTPVSPSLHGMVKL